MPYPSGHREQVRNRIVETARRLFNRSGFETVSVDSIMAHAGLTRGAFYSYFGSKSDLYAEVLRCFFTDPNWKNRWEGVDVDLESPNVGPQIISAYLSRQHFDDVENSCPMVALPGDVSRCGERVKGAFETVFRAMVATLGREVRSTVHTSENAALAIAALCIGGMVVARALNDNEFCDRLRGAAMHAALVLGGWNSANDSRPAKGPVQTRKVRQTSGRKSPRAKRP